MYVKRLLTFCVYRLMLALQVDRQQPYWGKLSSRRLTCLRRHNLAVTAEPEDGSGSGLQISSDMSSEDFSLYLARLFPDVEDLSPATFMHETILPVTSHHRNLSIFPKTYFKNPYHDCFKIVKGDSRKARSLSTVYLGKLIQLFYNA
jgi:hypothetical protein